MTSGRTNMNLGQAMDYWNKNYAGLALKPPGNMSPGGPALVGPANAPARPTPRPQSPVPGATQMAGAR